MSHWAGTVSSLGLEVFKLKLGGSKVLPHLCIQLHDMGYFIPAKAHKSGVIAGTVTRHHHIGLIVSGPLHTVRGLSLPPASIVCGCVALGPLMVPVEQDRARSQAEARSSLGGRG